MIIMGTITGPVSPNYDNLTDALLGKGICESPLY